MLCGETVAIYPENHTEHTDTFCGHNAAFLYAGACGPGRISGSDLTNYAQAMQACYFFADERLTFGVSCVFQGSLSSHKYGAVGSHLEEWQRHNNPTSEMLVIASRLCWLGRI
jgi:hypothetical protein